METSQATRISIITLHGVGLSNGEIARRIGVSKNTVALWIKRFEDTGTTMDQPRSGRPRCTSSEQDEAITAALHADPSATATSIREQHGIRCSPQTIRNRSRGKKSRELGLKKRKDYAGKHLWDNFWCSKEIRQQPDAGPTTPSTSEDGVPPGNNKGRPANKTRKRKILAQDVTQIQTEDQDEQQSGPRTKRKGSKEKTSESQREETLDKEVLVQPNTCTHKHNIHVDVSSKGWQVFGIPVKEENSDSDGFNEELQGKIKEIDEIVKEEEIYCHEGLSCEKSDQGLKVKEEEKPDQGLKVKEEDLENDVFVKVGIEDSDESKKEDTTDGDLYVTVGIHDV